MYKRDPYYIDQHHFFYWLKGPCHEIINNLFGCLKYSTWAPYEQAKVVNDYAVTLF